MRRHLSEVLPPLPVSTETQPAASHCYKTSTVFFPLLITKEASQSGLLIHSCAPPVSVYATPTVPSCTTLSTSAPLLPAPLSPLPKLSTCFVTLFPVKPSRQDQGLPSLSKLLIDFEKLALPTDFGWQSSVYQMLWSPLSSLPVFSFFSCWRRPGLTDLLDLASGRKVLLHQGQSQWTRQKIDGRIHRDWR